MNRPNWSSKVAWRRGACIAVLSLCSIAGVGCYDGTEGIPQFDVRPLSDAAATEGGGGDGPRADGGDAASDRGPTDSGTDVPDAAVTPDGAHADASADAPADGGAD